MTKEQREALKWLQTPEGKEWKRKVEEAAAKEIAIKTARAKNPHCRYWYKGDLKNYIEPTKAEKKSPAYLMQLGGIRRQVSHYASIILGRPVPVTFSTGEQSYSHAHEGDEGIVVSATTDPRKLDAVCGLTMHEAAHIKWTQWHPYIENSIPLFDFLRMFARAPQEFIPEKLLTRADELKISLKDLQRDIKFVLNVIEDRRIDRLMYEESPGWKPYYDAMYDEDLHTAEVSGFLLHPTRHTPTVENYRYHICMMTNEYASAEFLPRLQEIWDLIDLTNIKRFAKDSKWQSWPTQSSVIKKTGLTYYDQAILPDMIQVVFKIVDIIYEASTEQGKPAKDQIKPDQEPEFDPNNLDIPEDDGSGDFSQDGENTKIVSVDPNDYNSEAFRKLMEQIEKSIDGQYKKEYLDKSQYKEMKALEEAEASLTAAGDEEVGVVSCIVYRKLTTSLLDSDGFIFRAARYAENNDAVREGLMMGNLLATKITVLADETPIIYSRQLTGRLDKKLVASLGFNNDKVFSHTQTIRHAPIFIHLSVDASGSMAGPKWFQAIKLAAALAAISKKIRTIDLVVSFRGGNDLVNVLIAFDSRTDDISKIAKYFPKIGCNSATPEGLAYQAIQDLILNDDPNKKKQKKYFINISDGMPMFGNSQAIPPMNYRGPKAHGHTARRVNEMRLAGINIMSYFVQDGSGEAAAEFKQMYGKDAQFVNVQQVSAIAMTLNAMMLKGEATVDR